MDEIRRASDGELCGFVRALPEGFEPLTVFGGRLLAAASPTHDEAAAVVREHGLAALAERWLLADGASADEEEVVCIQEASPAGVTVALGYYSLPGVPTRRIDRDELATGRVRLRRER